MEVLVVLGIVGIVSSSALVLAAHSVGRDLCDAETSSVQRILFHARNEAVVSYFQNRDPTGLTFLAEHILMFWGLRPEDDPTPETFSRMSNTHNLSAYPHVFFVPRAGGVDVSSTTVTISGPACKRSIHINESADIS